MYRPMYFVDTIVGEKTAQDTHTHTHVCRENDHGKSINKHTRHTHINIHIYVHTKEHTYNEYRPMNLQTHSRRENRTNTHNRHTHTRAHTHRTNDDHGKSIS